MFLPIMAPDYGPREWTPEQYRQRPRDFDPALGRRIIDRVANGEALFSICADRDMPLPAVFLEWCRQDEDLGNLLAQARADRAELLVDSLHEVVKDSDAYRGRNAIEAYKLQAQLIDPGRYGPSAQRQPPGSPTTRRASAATELRRRLDAMARRQAEAQADHE